MKVAIKILEKSKIVDNIDLERILQEISLLKKLKHRNIIQIYEVNNYSLLKKDY